MKQSQRKTKKMAINIRWRKYSDGICLGKSQAGNGDGER